LEFIEITVRKFNTLVKRKDLKSPQWFAMPNEILSHPDFFDVDGDEFKVFAWVLGVAAKLNMATIRVYPDLCAHQARVTAEKVASTIEKLNGKRWDVTRTSRARHADVPLQDSTVQDSTEKEEEWLSKNPYFKRLPADQQALILKTYPKDFLERELISAISHIESNPVRYMNGEARFLASHFARQWEYYKSKRPAATGEALLTDWGKE